VVAATTVAAMTGAAGSATSGPRRDSLRRLADEVVRCRRCPRLVEWREQAAANPPRRYAGERYWARPLPGFGDPRARIAVLGLAPAAHGGNRTGRIFTGDRSGDWLFAALHRAGLANQPTSISKDDGLRLRGAYVTAVNRCPPPANRPTPQERDNCLPYLVRELQLLGRVKAVVALGSFAWQGALLAFARLGHELPRPRPKFGHGAEVEVGRYALLGCYHPSQQNTFTGKLTEPMIDDVFERARQLAR
jgi:uracil-DNA glycosylase